MKRKRTINFIVIIGLIAILQVMFFAGFSQEQVNQHKNFVIKNGSIIPMASPNAIKKNAIVFISNNRIESIYGSILK
jgi:hypothetical protein